MSWEIEDQEVFPVFLMTLEAELGAAWCESTEMAQIRDVVPTRDKCSSSHMSECCW